MSEASHSLVLYDGDCGLCHGFVQWLVKRDTRDALRFAPIQGDVAAGLLPRHGRNTHSLDTVFLVQGWRTPGEKVLERGDAAIAAIVALGGLWRAATALRVFPRFLRDRVYDFIATHRLRWFGKSTCRIPTKAERSKFVDSPG